MYYIFGKLVRVSPHPRVVVVLGMPRPPFHVQGRLDDRPVDAKPVPRNPFDSDRKIFLQVVVQCQLSSGGEGLQPRAGQVAMVIIFAVLLRISGKFL